uniref:GFO/IDH/MocA-like oxidoreductase domain-containing protein n=1 Tax=Phenylobacterium glaciei TaxID=2803784 RepID=A0A974S8Q8_9CAUL|nr:hypothetical protein JKL49_15575 [Phenylobacterium glaciei]
MLCEKPFAMNAGEARAMVAAADASGKVLMEAFHYRYHPLFARVLEIIGSEELGEIRELSAVFQTNLVDDGTEIRYERDLGGGSLMDIGTYPALGAHGGMGRAHRGARVRGVRARRGGPLHGGRTAVPRWGCGEDQRLDGGGDADGAARGHRDARLPQGDQPAGPAGGPPAAGQDRRRRTAPRDVQPRPHLRLPAPRLRRRLSRRPYAPHVRQGLHRPDGAAGRRQRR